MLSIYCYDPESGLQKRPSVNELGARVHTGGGMVWVDIESPTDDEVAILDDQFAFHPLAIEDCREAAPYPKLDNFKAYLFLVVLAPDLLSAEQEDPVMAVLNVFLGRNYVVTYHKRPLKSIMHLRERAENSAEEVMGRGAAFLVHAVLDALVDQHYAAVRRLDDTVEHYQDRILEEPRKETLDRILALRSHVLQLKRILTDERNLMAQFAGGIGDLVTDDAKRYYADLSEHLDELGDALDVSRDSLAGARDLYLSVSANRTNEIMRVLAIIATMMMPLMFVTSLYGMNVSLPGDDAPGLSTFGALVGIMAAIAASFFAYFRYRRWI